MRKSPRLRRLESDFRAMQQLRDSSSILDFSVPGALYGGPPEVYSVYFFGKGFWRANGSSDVLVREKHEVSISLGAGYPRMIPELVWKTPIFHPNISANGVVCLGGYSTHWVPSLKLDELCRMLWDMIRYANYDVDSPYNREAAQWTREQRSYPFPIDSRPIRHHTDDIKPTPRDRTAADYRLEDIGDSPFRSTPQGGIQAVVPGVPSPQDIVFMEDEVVDAEIVPAEATGESDILFID